MKKTVLIIDDDVKVTQVISDSLKKREIVDDVLTATDPIKGLEVFSENMDSIAVLVSDYYMPLDNGIELCRIVKERKKNVVTILFTGDHNLSISYDYGHVDIVLYKPQGLNDLIECIKKVLKKGPSVDGP